MTALLRWTTAAMCLIIGAGVACAPFTSPGTDPRAVGPAVAVGLVGVAVLGLGVAGWTQAVGGATVLLAAGYGISLVGRGTRFDNGVLVIAPALLLVTEIAYWSLDARLLGAEADWPRRAARTLAEAAAALLAAGGIQAAVALPSARGVGLSALGVAAAVGVLAVADRLGRRARAEDPAPGR